MKFILNVMDNRFKFKKKKCVHELMKKKLNELM